jgi:hypothetical protein
MNERIRELYVKAYGYFPAPIGEPELEKFAELIVKECSKWIVDNAGAIENLGPKYFAQAMIKDFGVEE